MGWGSGTQQGAQIRDLEEGSCLRRAEKGRAWKVAWHLCSALQRSKGEQGSGPSKGPAIKAQGLKEQEWPPEAQARSLARKWRTKGQVWARRLRKVDKAGEETQGIRQGEPASRPRATARCQGSRYRTRAQAEQGVQVKCRAVFLTW